MNGATLEVLEERTGRLLKSMDDHVEDDKRKFTEVFLRLNKIDVTQAKSGVIIAAAVIFAQIVVGAWVKGMF